MYKYKKDDKTYSEIRNEYKIKDTDKDAKIRNTDKNTEDQQKSDDYKSLFNKLKSKNSDYRFWIKVKNTNIDFPVVQGNDNSFYLKHDFYKSSSFSGCPFVHYRNDIKKDQNIIIYGHNMRNNNMFNQLEKFKNFSFFNNDNDIVVTDEEGQHIYKVFSAYTAKSNEQICKTNYSNKDEFLKEINDMKSKSLFKKDIQFNKDDRIITLVTCTYEINDGRLIVEGKLIK